MSEFEQWNDPDLVRQHYQQVMRTVRFKADDLVQHRMSPQSKGVVVDPDYTKDDRVTVKWRLPNGMEWETFQSLLELAEDIRALKPTPPDTDP